MVRRTARTPYRLLNKGLLHDTSTAAETFPSTAHDGYSAATNHRGCLCPPPARHARACSEEPKTRRASSSSTSSTHSKTRCGSSSKPHVNHDLSMRSTPSASSTLRASSRESPTHSITPCAPSGDRQASTHRRASSFHSSPTTPLASSRPQGSSHSITRCASSSERHELSTHSITSCASSCSSKRYLDHHHHESSSITRCASSSERHGSSTHSITHSTSSERHHALSARSITGSHNSSGTRYFADLVRRRQLQLAADSAATTADTDVQSTMTRRIIRRASATWHNNVIDMPLNSKSMLLDASPASALTWMQESGPKIRVVASLFGILVIWRIYLSLVP